MSLLLFRLLKLYKLFQQPQLMQLVMPRTLSVKKSLLLDIGFVDLFNIIFFCNLIFVFQAAEKATEVGTATVHSAQEAVHSAQEAIQR